MEQNNITAEIRTVEWRRKLTSRKLWTAVVGIVVGLAAAFGLPENDIAQIAGIVTSAASVVSYIFAEAKVDAAASNPINLNFNETAVPDDADVNDLK